MWNGDTPCRRGCLVDSVEDWEPHVWEEKMLTFTAQDALILQGQKLPLQWHRIWVWDAAVGAEEAHIMIVEDTGTGHRVRQVHRLRMEWAEEAAEGTVLHLVHPCIATAAIMGEMGETGTGTSDRGLPVQIADIAAGDVAVAIERYP